MRPVNQEELTWIEQNDEPYVEMFGLLRGTHGWIHLDLVELPGSSNLEAKKAALVQEAEARGVVLRVMVRPGNPAGGIFVRVLR